MTIQMDQEATDWGQGRLDVWPFAGPATRHGSPGPMRAPAVPEFGAVDHLTSSCD